MMITKCYSAPELFRGLRVSDYDDYHDFFHMTSFDIRFSVPGIDPDIDIDALKFIKCGMYIYLLNHGFTKDDIVNYGSIEKSAITFSLSPYLNKTQAFNLVVRMCYYVLSLTDIIPTEETDYIHKIEKGKDGAKSVINSFLEEITTNGKYQYTEESI